MCGRAESHGIPKQWLPESVCINSLGGLLKDTWPGLTQRFSLGRSGGPKDAHFQQVLLARLTFENLKRWSACLLEKK